MPAPAPRRTPAEVEQTVPVSGPQAFGRMGAPLVLSAVTDPVHLVTSAELATFARVTLPAGSEEGVQLYLDGLVASLSALLNRPILVRQIVDRLYPDEYGRVYLTGAPVTEVLELRQSGVPVLPPVNPTGYLWPVNALIEVTYRAGAADPQWAAARHAVLTKALPFVRALIATTTTADAGTDGSGGDPAGLAIPGPIPGVTAFTVEGLNVTYAQAEATAAAVLAAASSEAAAARWTPEELAASGLTRRPVVA